MSGLVNKVKEALHSAQDTPTDERSGKINLTAEERERLEAAGYGREHHAEKRHLGASEDIMQAPGGHPPSYYLNQGTTITSSIPGSFPESQQESIGSQQHKDGREYVAPKGTHVGSATSGPQQDPDPTLTTSTNYGTSSNIQGNSRTPGTDTRATDTTTTGAETAAAVGGAGAIAAHETKSGPNKLHKKEDPKSHVAFNDPPSHEVIHGTQPTAITSSTQHPGSATREDTSTAVHHSLAGTHHASRTQQSGDLYDQQASRKYDGNANPTDTPNYSYPSVAAAAATTSTAVAAGGLASTQLPDRTQHDERSATTSQPASTQGHRHVSGTVYNTVTGAGSHEDPTNARGSSEPGSSALPREAGNPPITSGGQGVVDSNTTTSSSTAPLPATLTAGRLGHGTTSMTSQSGTAVTGSGHMGSRVVHTCTKCGEDNDITHYFQKESMSRLNQ